MIAVIDYGAGNLRSISRALQSAGAEVVVTSDPAVVRSADAVVLPGVGHAGHSVEVLTELGMPEADGIIKRTSRSNGRADLMVFAKEEAAQKRLLLAGCDPTASLLSNMVEQISGVEIVSAAASSKAGEIKITNARWGSICRLGANGASATSMAASDRRVG